MRGHSLWPGLPHGGGGGVLVSQTSYLAGVEVTLGALGVSGPVRMVRAAAGLDSHSLTLDAVSWVVPSESLGSGLRGGDRDPLLGREACQSVGMCSKVLVQVGTQVDPGKTLPALSFLPPCLPKLWGRCTVKAVSPGASAQCVLCALCKQEADLEL